jgi:hypothetical protein
MNPLVGETRLTVAIAIQRKILDFGMAPRSNELPKTGFAVEIDGRIKAEFNTREGAENGAVELKRRFPALRIASMTQRRNRGTTSRPEER